MPRPKSFRQLSWIPPATLFLPQGVEEGSPRVLTLRLEEVEVIRQIDLEGLEQEDVADRMGVSRATVGRILAAGRRSVAQALVGGHGIAIRGGVYRYERAGVLTCPLCQHRQPIVPGTRRSVPCRKCCHPVQEYLEPSTHQQNREEIVDLHNATIAIASDDGNTITSHFGRAPFYTVLTFKNGDIVHRETRSKFAPHAAGDGHHGGEAGEPHAAHSARHVAMAESIRDCQVVIARGMGDGAYVHLTEAGLTVIMTELHKVDELEGAVKSGALLHQPQRIHQHGQGH